MTDLAAGEDILESAVAWLGGGRRVALATVIHTWGSSPRPAGSRLLVDDRGAFLGSVSGGCVEGAVIAGAAEVLASGAPRLVAFGVSDDEAWSVGLSCGGHIEVYIEPLQAPPELLQHALSERAAGRTTLWVTDLDRGEHRLLARDAEPAGLHPALRTALADAAAQDRAVAVDTPDGRLFVAPIAPRLRMFIIGAVHIAQPLCQMARWLGFDVTVVDPRSGYASPARFPEVTLLRRWPHDVLAETQLDSRCVVITLTHDPKLDEPALIAALASGAFYIGALGSRRTHAARLQRLRAQGLSDQTLQRIRGPIGLDIGSRSAAEIATSIAADVVLHLRRGPQ